MTLEELKAWYAPDITEQSWDKRPEKWDGPLAVRNLITRVEEVVKEMREMGPENAYLERRVAERWADKLEGKDE